MKIAYYIITIILSALATGLFLLISFPVSEGTGVSLTVAIMMAGFLISSITGLIKQSFIPGIMLTKTGIFLAGFGGFCLIAVFNGNHLSIPFIALIILLWVLAIVCILEGINICRSRREMKEADAAAIAARNHEMFPEIPLTNAGLPADPTAPVKKIWQYRIDGKPEYTRKDITKKWTFLLLSLAGVFTGLVLPMILMFSFDIVLYGEPVGFFLFLLAFLSIFGFAMTLGVFKEHHTENRAFVLGEDGSVFMINYFQPAIAHEFGYYSLLPRILKRDTVGKVSNTFASIHYSVEAARCLRYIRESGIDKKIAEKRAVYGHQISGVPEICRCSYFSEIHFSLWVGGSEQKYKNWYNLYDNCYEDYEEMLEYFATKFTHCSDKEFQKKTKGLRVMTGIGIFLLSIGVVSFVGVMLLEMNSLYIPGFLGLLVGLSMLASGLDALRRRHPMKVSG
ncbi:MAG: hypothetical protein K6C99_06125 [Lachnospiraceae bacterium]|nr:hypothetical protein [Lachnospiraceae bacterium]